MGRLQGPTRVLLNLRYCPVPLKISWILDKGLRKRYKRTTNPVHQYDLYVWISYDYVILFEYYIAGTRLVCCVLQFQHVHLTLWYTRAHN